MNPYLRLLSSVALASAVLLPCDLLSAQNRGNAKWVRSVEPSADRSIFSALDLPTPDRVRTASGAPGPDYWQQEANYAIDVTLDPQARSVIGKEHVTYVNRSPDALDYVWVHLEQNAMREDSICSSTQGNLLMGGRSEPSDGVELKQVASDGKDLHYQVYDTLMRVDVPTIAPGATFAFDVAWQFKVPTRVFRRYGTLDTDQGTVWEIAQWFPAVAVYDDVHGWNTLPYIGGGEFYTNHGTYDVRITVPHEFVVVATGVLQNPEQVWTVEQQRRLVAAKQSETTVMIIDKDEVGTKESRPEGTAPLTWTFHADKVRTFAWAASPAFLLDAAALGTTLCQSAYTKGVAGAWSKSTQMLRKAIGGYSQRWFPFPYPMATNVAGVEVGMEYPMIIFCRANDETELFQVTTHEIGHTWFPMVVNTDERRHAWMDEGFNTFINIYSEAEWFGRSSSPRTGRIARMLANVDRVPVDTPADQLSGQALGMLEYMKTGTGLQMLREHILGPERFDYAFRTYIRRWAFKSPQPADFFRSMEDASGADLAWFWRGWFLEPAKLDQAIEEVREDDKGATVVFTNLDRMVMPLHYRVTWADDTVENRKLPVEIWHSSNRVAQKLPPGKSIKKIEIDPEQAFPDSARANNVWPRPEDEKKDKK